MKKAIKVLGTVAISAIVMTVLIACGPPRLRGTVTIDGDPLLGNTLTANIASLGGSGIITYQWLRDGSTSIADTNSYTLQDADRDSAITVTVIRSDNSDSVTSAPVTAYGYLIGDTGPGGGIIFYQDSNGFTMTDTGEKAYYMEAATVNQGSLAWASPAFIPPSSGGRGNWRSIEGTSTAIGTGRRNTALILATDANAPAALACKNYRGGGKDDWFLPSRDELDELYRQRSRVGIGSSGWFWSSSQYVNSLAWVQNFSSGLQGPNDKNYTDIFVRAIRAF